MIAKATQRNPVLENKKTNNKEVRDKLGLYLYVTCVMYVCDVCIIFMSLCVPAYFGIYYVYDVCMWCLYGMYGMCVGWLFVPSIDG